MTGPGGDSPIEAYLDELMAALSGERPRAVRRLVAEAEAHLLDAAEAGLTEGLSAYDAEARAVARFGPARELASAERNRLRTPVGAVLRQAIMSAWLLGAIGAQAVGASGVVALVIRLIGGERLLVDVRPGQVLSAADCTRWLSIRPNAKTCADAAVSDWADEVVGYRIAVGLLGVLALLAYFWFRRHLARRVGGLPTVVTDTIAATLFAAAGVWTLGLGVDAVAVGSGHGSGQWFSAAPVAMGAAAVFGLRMLRDVRATPT